MKGSLVFFLLISTISMPLVLAAEISIEVFEESIIPKAKANTTSEISGPLLSAKSDTVTGKNENGKKDDAAKAMAVGVPVDFEKEQREAAAKVTGKDGRDHSKRMGDNMFGVPKPTTESSDGFVAMASASAPSFSLPDGQQQGRGAGGGIGSFWSVISPDDDESRSFDRFISGWNGNFPNHNQHDEGKGSASSLSASVVSPLDPVVASAGAVGPAIDPSLAALRSLASSMKQHQQQPFTGHGNAGSEATAQFGEELGLSAYPAAASAGESMCFFTDTLVIASSFAFSSKVSLIHIFFSFSFVSFAPSMPAGVQELSASSYPSSPSSPSSSSSEEEGGIFRKYMGRIPRIVRRPASLMKGVFFKKSKLPHLKIPSLPFRGLWKVSKFHFFGRKKNKHVPQQQLDSMAAGGIHTILPNDARHPNAHFDVSSHHHQLHHPLIDQSDKHFLALFVPKNLHLTPLHQYDHLMQQQQQQLPHFHNRPEQQNQQQEQQQPHHLKQQNADTSFKPHLHL